MKILSCNWISSRARYDRFDTPPCINLSMILYEEIISSQPRYDHFDTSPSYGKSPKETCFSVSDTSGAPRYVPLRCPKFYARCLHRRISTAATRSTPLTPPPAAVVSLPTSIRLHILNIIPTLLWKIKGLGAYRHWLPM